MPIANRTVAKARKQSIERLKNGKWLSEFNEHYSNALNNQETIKSSLFCMKALSLSWGIVEFPELKEYAISKIDEVETLLE